MIETTTTGKSEQNQVFVLVFAHPDDESMFFLPTIRWLIDAKETVWFLCLTTGNYDGLGKIREKEMEEAGKLLGVSKVIVRNDHGSNAAAHDTPMVDHPSQRFDKTVVANTIRESLLNNNNGGSNQRFVLITFDAKGVSGHVNHTDVYRGVVHLMEDQERQRKESKKSRNSNDNCDACFSEAWYLESEPNLLVKYVPLISWILLLATWLVSPKLRSTLTLATNSNNDTTIHHTTRIFRMHDPSLNWAAMATHQSQFVWYRRLFVVFSCYTYYNKLLCKKVPNR